MFLYKEEVLKCFLKAYIKYFKKFFKNLEVRVELLRKIKIDTNSKRTGK